MILILILKIAILANFGDFDFDFSFFQSGDFDFDFNKLRVVILILISKSLPTDFVQALFHVDTSSPASCCIKQGLLVFGTERFQSVPT